MKPKLIKKRGNTASISPALKTFIVFSFLINNKPLA
jgi:hypothetical protein